MKDTPKFPMQEGFLGAEFSGIARGHVKPTLFKLVFIFSIFLVCQIVFGSAWFLVPQRGGG